MAMAALVPTAMLNTWNTRAYSFEHVRAVLRMYILHVHVHAVF